MKVIKIIANDFLKFHNDTSKKSTKYMHENMINIEN